MAKMELCEYSAPSGCQHCQEPGCARYKFRDILVEDTTIARMYKNEHMTRIMSDHNTLNMYDNKYAMAMQLQETDECTVFPITRCPIYSGIFKIPE